ncbi:MAG TPA: amidohydrolase family protein [Vicinamibacteria bacterium]|nr:amidohydrolase family protein [Vicinamibacteria bacterium]
MILEIALAGATLLDLDGGPPISDAVVVIEDDRIRAIGSSIPEGAEVIRADGTYLIPGLINVHVHLGLVLPGSMAAELANETEAELALRMAANARRTLEAGVTTIRLPGDERHVDLALKRAIDRGDAVGPRIFSAGEMVDITGGHGADEETHDGPYELRKAVREQIAAGASWIKIAISGGIATPRGDIAEALMTPDEIEAVIDAAHRFGARVTAHSGSPSATSIAIDSGIDCIEHGYFLTREVLRKMKENGTWLVPTIVVSQPKTMPFFERIGSPPWYLERVKSVGPLHWESLRMAIEEGVSIALGTDQFPFEPNDGTTATIREAEYYVAAGMTPRQAIRSATIRAAELLQAADVLGSIAPGKYADILAVASDPTVDISALRNIRLVVKGGQVIRRESLPVAQR